MEIYIHTYTIFTITQSPMVKGFDKGQPKSPPPQAPQDCRGDEGKVLGTGEQTVPVKGATFLSLSSLRESRLHVPCSFTKTLYTTMP